MRVDDPLWAAHARRTPTPLLWVAFALLVTTACGSLASIVWWLIAARWGAWPPFVVLFLVPSWIPLTRLMLRELRRRRASPGRDDDADAPHGA